MDRQTVENMITEYLQPVFHSFGVNGSTGKKSPEEFFRSGLVQKLFYKREGGR